ncbi:MAG: pitrilysin family protein [Patescibacteria group bacterium]
MANFKKFKLDNGLRVILVPQPSSFATSVAVLVEAGSKYETKDINGLSHFLEHMCFKGTKKRPSALTISSELDGLGAQYNAFTSREFTSYYAKSKNDSTEKLLEIISDLYLNPVFNEAEIEKEKGVIIEEINMYEDVPQRKIQDLFTELLYGDQPAGWDIAGRKEVIQSLKRDDFIKYRSKHYLPQATTIVISGGFKDNGLEEQIKSYFGGLRPDLKGEKLKVIDEQAEPKELVKFKESDQTHLVMGFRAFDAKDERRYALEVLCDILGGSMSSRLFQKIRDELGAAYYVNAGADLSTDHGYVAMSAGINHQKIEEVIKAGLQEFKRFKEEKVSEEELVRAKDHIAGHLYLSLETSDELGYFYGMPEIMGLELKTPEELIKEIRAVSAEDIQKVANEILTEKTLNFAVIGPFKEKSFRDMLRM